MDTPYLAIEQLILHRNLRTLARWADTHSLSIRPHAKTHKIIEIAQQQINCGAVGISVATIGEAEAFAASGIEDIFIPYSLWANESVGARLRAVAAHTRLRVAIDSIAGAQAMGTALRGTDTEALIEIDCGHHRCGTTPDGAAAVADAAVNAGLHVVGVFTFPGHSYAPDAASAAADDEAEAITRASDSLRAGGIVPSVRSGGSTPSARKSDANVLTEIRPGVYVLNDAQQLELGTCTISDIALSAVSTAIHRHGNRIVVDAGSKIIGTDRPAWVSGFGRVRQAPHARIVALSEHHATVEYPTDADSLPTLGSRLHIIPNHVCTAVNLVDRIAVVGDESRAGDPANGYATDGDGITAWWPVAARGRF